MKHLAWKSAAAALALAAAFATNSATAQEKVPYPADSVTLVTHSSPGGGTDVFLREMVKYLGEYLDANFVVENVRGGSGAKAMAFLADSPTDGSVLYGTTPTFINTSLLSKPEKTYQDLQPVVNIFLASSALQFAISVIGVLIFAGLTAYDTQSIKNEYLGMSQMGPEGAAYMQKGAIMGALRLYLDFLNMFMFLLQFMGNRE